MERSFRRILRVFLSSSGVLVCVAVLSGCVASAIVPTTDKSVDPEAELRSELDQIKAQQKQLEQQLAELARRDSELDTRERQLDELRAELELKQQRYASAVPLIQTSYEGEIEYTKSGSIVLGALERIYLEPPGIKLPARIDTGAQTSSLNAVDMTEFERDGKPYVRFHIIDPNNGEKVELVRRVRDHVRIKEVDGRSHRRPVVRMRVVLANIDERIEFTLADRSNFNYQALIGRNFLRDLAVVDVSKKYAAPTASDKLDNSDQ